MSDLFDVSDPANLAMLGATVCIGLFGAMVLLYAVIRPMGPAKVLPLDDFKEFPLIRKQVLSHDTARFTFGLPKDHILGLPTGQHMTIQFKDKKTDKMVQRSYTPVTDDTTIGEVSLVIKVYRPLKPKFPEGGKMSQHIDSLEIGDTIRMKGPKGHMTWKGKGNFSVKPIGKPFEERKCQYLGLMAGGTGITPMLQILNAIFTNPGDSSIKGVKMIYANQSPDDILVRKELEALAAAHKDRFSLWYTVDRVDKGTKWEYSTGFIDKEMIEAKLLFPGKRMQFFMCGPPPMIKFACVANLEALGFSAKDWVSF